MGKLGYSSITLTDLTETLPVSLVLKSNKDSNITLINLFFIIELKELHLHQLL
jgi:hypothetical protein